MRRFAALVLVVAAAVPFVGSTARAGADDPWLGLLERLPDTADVRSFVVLNDYDAAAECALDCPHLEYGGTIEIRQVDAR